MGLLVVGHIIIQAWLRVPVSWLGGPVAKVRALSCAIVVHLRSSHSESGPQTESAKSTKHDYTAIKVDHYIIMVFFKCMEGSTLDQDCLSK